MPARYLLPFLLLPLLSGCMLETLIFPIFEDAFPLETPPAALGPYEVEETHLTFDDLGDGEPGGVTIIAPRGMSRPGPAIVWVLGVNNRVHFHEGFHTYMASWGYTQVAVDTRDIVFSDTRYHARNTGNALRAVERLLNGELGVTVAGEQVAVGGYSVGGTMAAFVGAESSAVAAVLMWAPAPSPIWQGVDPFQTLPQVRQPSLFLLGELDIVVGDWPEQMQGLMQQSQQEVEVIANGVHLFFQQPSVLDDRNPLTDLTRPEQLGMAFELSRAYLDEVLGVVRESQSD